MKATQNPYAARDGSPKDGMEAEWSAWIDKHEQARRAALTPQQRAAEDAARRPLLKRMQVESDFR